MGAQSDFIAETFVPDEDYRAQQMVRARHLLATGMSREQVAAMLSISLELLPEEAESGKDVEQAKA
jgi:hypothetical protein